MRSYFGGKVAFGGGRKTGENPSESDWDQPITAHVRAQDRTRVAVMGGEDDDHCANPTPHIDLQVYFSVQLMTNDRLSYNSVNLLLESNLIILSKLSTHPYFFRTTD